jgi:TorA maturation chaperone TorD
VSGHWPTVPPDRRPPHRNPAGGPGRLRVLGRLLLEEPTPEDLPALRRLPELGELVPAEETPPEKVEAWLQAMRVEHQRLFGMNVYPYESAFLSTRVALHTGETASVDAAYRSHGFNPPGEFRYGAPDHAGVELLATAYLVESGDEEALIQWLAHHAARWLPVFSHTLGRMALEPLFRALGNAVTEAVLEELDRIGPMDVERISPPPARGSDPSGKAPGSDEDLGEIIAYLSIPSRAGVFLTRHDIGSLGQRLELPVGMLDRALMLRNLFRAAGQFGRAPDLVDGLHRIVSGARDHYQELVRRHSSWSPQGRPWVERSEATLSLLARMRSEAESPAP